MSAAERASEASRAEQAQRMSGASKRANGRASGPVLQSVSLAVLYYSARGCPFIRPSIHPLVLSFNLSSKKDKSARFLYLILLFTFPPHLSIERAFFHVFFGLQNCFWLKHSCSHRRLRPQLSLSIFLANWKQFYVSRRRGK